MSKCLIIGAGTDISSFIHGVKEHTVTVFDNSPEPITITKASINNIILPQLQKSGKEARRERRKLKRKL